ncbi:MAG: hypothetical protein WCX48_06570 [Bacteroidales bacterium]
MKRTILIISSILLTTAILAQNRYDALKYSQQFYEGSARSIAMGNAFTSIGGDLGVLSINPASSAVYKYSEFQFTPSIAVSDNESHYIGNSSSDAMTKFGISSLGYVSSFNTSKRSNKLLNLNLSFAINKLNNFNSRSSANGRTSESSWLSDVAASVSGIKSSELDIQHEGDTYPYFSSGAPWRGVLAWNSNLLDLLPDSDKDYIAATENIIGNSIVIGGELEQEFSRETTGGLSEFILNVSGNISNKFYFGASLGIQTLQYEDFQRYSETAMNPAMFDSGFQNFSHVYKQETSGAGVNAKFGVIYTPVKGLRFGASIATPTYMSLTDEWYERIYSKFSDGYNQSIFSPDGEYDYTVTSPMRFNLGVSYVFGNLGTISADYEGVDYSSIEMDEDESNGADFDEENRKISNEFDYVNNFRLGAEVRPVGNIALRAGYSFYQNPEKNYGYDSEFFSFGAGIRTKRGIFADLGIQRRISKSENFSLYNDIKDPDTNITVMEAPIGKFDYSGWKFLLTIGFRF